MTLSFTKAFKPKLPAIYGPHMEKVVHPALRVRVWACCSTPEKLKIYKTYLWYVANYYDGKAWEAASDGMSEMEKAEITGKVYADIDNAKANLGND